MHGRLCFGLAILTTSLLMGCGGGSMASRKTGSKPAAGAAGGGSSAGGGSASSSGGSTAPRPPAAGELAVSPKTLDFGKVTVGTTKGLTGALTAGNATITVKSAAWSGEGYSVSGIVFPATIPAGQSAHFKVIFAPQAAGTSSGGIKFSSNATHSTQAAFSGQGTRTPAHSVTLSWHSSSASVAGYNVYRGVNSKGPYTKITGSLHPKSTFTDASVVGGVTYYYMTTAVNKKGKESKYSNQVRVMIPNS